MALTIFGATAFRAQFLAAAVAVAAVSAGGFGATDAIAQQPKKQRDAQGRPLNYSYQAGPRTRVYVTRRSWLDAGTEVLPGERKFTDYAFPPGYHYGRSIDRLNTGRNPLSDNFDIGGGPATFPLY
ncbi:MAG: hypothetical protein EKK40_05890 [Bradyrhizobiaceae bacterium]|nr:MAG: hypothetical protein EKK40_05890 [Bradyrhizobiaceae bacterium]